MRRARNQMAIVLRMIFILKWDLPSISPIIQLFQTETRLLAWWQELKKWISIAPFGLLQENERSRAPQDTHNFAVRSPLRQLKQTTFCWPFNSWRTTATPPTSTITLTIFRKSLNPSQRQCPNSMGNQKTLNFLKISCKQVWKFTNSSQKTNSTTSTLSCVVMRCRCS